MLITRYSLIICRNAANKFLCVQERNGKWWIPGGKVQQGETFIQAAHREAKEEAGIDITLKGLIRVDSGFFFDQNIFRAIYLAQPCDQKQIPKQKSDNQSIQAQYYSIDEILKLTPHWRSQQIYQFPQYIIEGGLVSPLSVFTEGSLRI